jgi:RecB family exonuclease
MALTSEMLTPEEFASLLTVDNTSAVTSPPAVIPAAHSARLIALGYMVFLEGRLRMTTPGRIRIYAGQLDT